MIIESHTFTITYDDDFYDWYVDRLTHYGFKLKRSDTQTETYAKEAIYRPLRVEEDSEEIEK